MIFGKKIHVSDGDSDYRDQILDDIQYAIDVAHNDKESYEIIRIKKEWNSLR